MKKNTSRLAKLAKASLGIVACAAVTFSSYAIVTVNPDGTGFAGKGDVQTALGFNNKVMQDYHPYVRFAYNSTTIYNWTCEWETGPDRNITYHVQPHTETFGVQATIATDPRKTGQWTGWNLSGVPTGETSGGSLIEPCGNTEENGKRFTLISEESVGGVGLHFYLIADPNSLGLDLAKKYPLTITPTS